MDYSRITNEQLSILLEQEQDTVNRARIEQEIAKRFIFYFEREQIPRYDTSKETYKSVI